VFTDAATAGSLIRAGEAFGIEGRIVGRVEAAEKKGLVLRVDGEEIDFS
jgi:phosphoribosylformylglycinamidine cyclo-ligase